MPYLDTYSTLLTAKTAAHLLRRATFGPTHQEIVDFTGLTASQAVTRLIDNVTVTISEPPPIDLNANSPTYKQSLLSFPFSNPRGGELCVHLRYWWVGLMARQNGMPSLLEKLTAFWQNHFVVSQAGMADYRFSYQYLQLLRNNCFGNFRTLTIEMAKDPGMLIYQNGNDNVKNNPNENFARELQELFTVGAKDFAGNANYTEQDVKAAARVLTGWEAFNYYANGTYSFGTRYTSGRHDTSDKVFSSKYGNKIIAGLSDSAGGNTELTELVNMLTSHPESPKHICRKLYRWYVNPNVTQEIEDNVIIPLAIFFASSGNNYEIKPVVIKLLTSDIFFRESNVGAIIKSPMEYLIGMGRLFDLPVPDAVTDTAAYIIYIRFFLWGMGGMQLEVLNQPNVFGYPPYYQAGYSKNWINSATLVNRRSHVDLLVVPSIVVKPGYLLGLDLLKWMTSLQANFSSPSTTAAISCTVILNAFTKNLFAIELTQSQKDFLIDSVFMNKLPQLEWEREWNAYRQSPTDTNFRNVVFMRAMNLMKYLLRMGEFYLF